MQSRATMWLVPVGKRRTFGAVRELPSGRYQASYMHLGARHVAPRTFTKEREADIWLNAVHTDILRNQWVDQRGGEIRLRDYALEYLASPSIGAKWRDTCERNMRVHLDSLLDRKLVEVTPYAVRKWHMAALAGLGGRVSIAQSYRFLKAVMGQAERDELIGRNPCRIPGAGADRSRERQVATVAKLEELMQAIEPRYQAPVLIAAWCALRRQEIVELAPTDVDTETGVISIRKAKSPAGVRTVAVPPHIIPVLETARQWSDEQWFHTSPRGGRMAANTFYHAFVRARKRVGLEHITIHDLRHTGNTLAANAGATTKDLMKRLGHASDVAARRYLHTVEGRDAEIAKALSEVAKEGNAAKLPKRQKRTKRK